MPARVPYRVNPLDAAAEIAGMRGVAVVAAAGNGGPTQDAVDSPGDDRYVPDTLVRWLYPLLYGGPLVWKDPNYLGISWSSFNWTNLAWDNLAWDDLAWDDLAWDSSGKVD